MYQLENYKGLNFYSEAEIKNIVSMLDGKSRKLLGYNNGTSTEYYIFEDSDWVVCICSFDMKHKTVVLISKTDAIESRLIYLETNNAYPIYIKNTKKYREACLVYNGRTEHLIRRKVKKVALLNPYGCLNIINTDEVLSVKEIALEGYNCWISPLFSINVTELDDCYELEIVEVDRAGRGVVNALRRENFKVGLYNGCHLRISRFYRTEEEVYRGIGVYKRIAYGRYTNDVFREYLGQHIEVAVDYLVKGAISKEDLERQVLEAYKDDWRIILSNNLESLYEKYGIEYSLP